MDPCRSRSPHLLLALALVVAACGETPDPTVPDPGTATVVAAGPGGGGNTKVKVKMLQLASNTLNIDGPPVDGTVSVGNSGPALEGVLLRADIVQGATTRQAAAAFGAGCGPEGLLPNGTCGMAFTATASNAAPGSGTLVPGSAVLVMRVLQAVGGTETLLAAKTLDVNLAPSASISGLVLDLTTLAIDGPRTGYTATLENPGSSLTNVLLQGWIVQGAVRNGAGGVVVSCGAATGVLPPGTCSVASTAGASNTTGNGLLVPGPASFELELVRSAGGAVDVLDTEAVPVTLILNRPRITGLTFAESDLVLEGDPVPYTVTVDNPTGGPVPGVRLDGRIVQEPASRASGSSLAACPVADGTLPPGSCTMTLTARASNASSGTGTLVPALATFELALVRQTGEGDVILETRATAVNILDPLPRITDVELVQPWIALAGPGTDYIVTIDNPGPGRSSIRIQGWLVQGAEEGSVGDRHVNCGASGGVLPTGTCVTTGSFETVSGGGTGGMTQGPATLEVRLVESGGAGGTLLDTWSLSVMLVADAVGIVHVELDAPTIPLEGATGYTVTLYNPGPPVSGMLVQGEVEQGAARRAAGGTILGCPTFDGVLPTGLCTLRWDALASNSTGGTGTLVPGDAIFLLSLHEAFGVVDTRAVPVTLTGSAP